MEVYIHIGTPKKIFVIKGSIKITGKIIAEMCFSETVKELKGLLKFS